jgi:hypothetical protein
VFSAGLEDYLQHLVRVLTRIREVDLKLKPAKATLPRMKLGYLVTCEGLKPTQEHLKVQFQSSLIPLPSKYCNMPFLGLTSY